MFFQQFNRICCCSEGVAPKHKLPLLKAAGRNAQLSVTREMEVQASKKARQVFKDMWASKEQPMPHVGFLILLFFPIN